MKAAMTGKERSYAKLMGSEMEERRRQEWVERTIAIVQKTVPHFAIEGLFEEDEWDWITDDLKGEFFEDGDCMTTLIVVTDPRDLKKFEGSDSLNGTSSKYISWLKSHLPDDDYLYDSEGRELKASDFKQVSPEEYSKLIYSQPPGAHFRITERNHLSASLTCECCGEHEDWDLGCMDDIKYDRMPEPGPFEWETVFVKKFGKIVCWRCKIS